MSDQAGMPFDRLSLLSKRRPKDRESLHAWIKSVLGFNIPQVAVCPDHQAPFDVIADTYFGDVTRALILGGRGTGKTTLLAISTLLKSKFFPGTSTAYYGAVEAQGLWGFSYLKEMLKPEYMKEEIEKNVANFIGWSNGSWARAGTGRSATGITAFRCNRLVIDEVDLWDPAMYETAAYMVTGTHEHHPERLVASTAYTAYGMMTTLMGQVQRRGFSSFKICIMEIMERCPTCLKEQCPLYIWEHPRTGELEPLCQGRGLRADGFLPYEVVIDEFLATDSESYLVQKLLENPERRLLIYPTFSDKKHCSKPDKSLQKAMKQHGRTGVGVDWGFDHPLVFTVYTQMPNGKYYGVEERAERFATPSREIEIAQELRNRYGKTIPFYCGQDQPKSIQAFYEQGITVIPNLVALRDVGHRMVRRLLDPNKGPLLQIDPDAMPNTVFQLSTLHRDDKGKEILKDNDFADSSRYILASAQEMGGIDSGGGRVY